MGKIKQGILGGFSGKVGSVVGTSWKGIAVMRSLAQSVSNPNTAAQQAQRGAMGEIVEVARALLDAVIKPYWNPLASGMSGYNLFVKTNIAAFDQSGLVNYGDFELTRGNLSEPLFISGASTTNPGEVWFSTDANAGFNGDTSNLRLAILCYHTGTKQAEYYEASYAQINSGTAVAMPGVDDTANCELFTAWIDTASGEASNTTNV